MFNRLADYKKYALELIGQEFNRPELLQTAFTHRSYLNEHKKSAKEHNERLEFLGDAVLEIVVTEYLYLNYSQSEGILTNWRAALVRTESLAQAADRLEFVNYLRLSKGERKSTERAQQQIMANAFEAVIGAIYLDKGYQVAEEFIHKNIVSTLDDILKSGLWLDAKTRFQEYTQAKEGETPIYKILSEAGPDHDKMFKIGVYVAGELRGQGKGYSKQIAQQTAAEDALSKGQIDPVDSSKYLKKKPTESN